MTDMNLLYRLRKELADSVEHHEKNYGSCAVMPYAKRLIEALDVELFSEHYEYKAVQDVKIGDDVKSLGVVTKIEDTGYYLRMETEFKEVGRWHKNSQVQVKFHG